MLVTLICQSCKVHNKISADEQISAAQLNAKMELQKKAGNWAYYVAIGKRQALSKCWAQKGSPIDPKRCAIVVVHMQKMTMEPNGLMDSVGLYNPQLRDAWLERLDKITLPNLDKLIAFFRGKNLPIIFTHLGDEGTHPGFLPCQGNNECDISTTANIFINTNLEQLLKEREIDTLLITGVGTSHCVTFSAFGALSLGYQVILIPDATADPRPDHYEAIVKILGLHAFLQPTEKVISDYPWQNWIEAKPLPPVTIR
jgi:nicotinamidase-related amidase